ncbi:MAG: MazG nucleotide pyrophosphohydrolase domain-containing protein [Planctomycetota bacterium]
MPESSGKPASRAPAAPPVGLGEFQARIEAIYLEKDRGRGLAATYLWFAEEVGELTRALRRGADREHLEEEFADVLAWLSTMASISGIDLERAVERKYGRGCPYCGKTPCACG